MSNYTTILSQKQRWGFAIYRTDYSSEADWTKFLAMFKTWPLHGFPGPQLENGRLARLWQQHYWMTGSQFDGTTIDQLRQHFQSRVASQGFGEQRTWPESYMFLAVDKDVLGNIHPQNPELDFLPRDQPPYIKATDKDHPDEREEYPGWMKLNLMDLLDVYSRGLDFQNMRGLRSRYSDWYKGHLPEKDTYLEDDDDESESSLDWGSASEGDENTSEN
jgi:hypothetical protein